MFKTLNMGGHVSGRHFEEVLEPGESDLTVLAQLN